MSPRVGPPAGGAPTPTDRQVDRRAFLRRMSAMTAAAGAGGLGSLASPLALDAATIGMHEAGAGRAGSVGSASAGPPAFSTSSGHAHATPSSRGPVSARRPRRTKPSARPQETDPAGLTVAEASALIRRAELSPVELVEACLARIEALDPVLMAFNTVVAEAARDHARAITDVAGAGALFGVPVALKDNYYTAGIRTTANSHIFADFVPDFDAEAWRRLRAQGAILLGKTQMGPLATSRATTPDGDNTTLSAWAPDDPSVSPGGSSSGSATAVAARMAPAATGTQTGGSITNPAQEQGLTGLKPTMGRISLRGIIPLTYTRDHPGPLARDAMDAAILLQAMAGPDPADPRTLGLPPVADYVVAATPVEAAGRPGLRWRTRIGVIPGYLDASPAGPEPTDAPRSRERTEAARLRQEADAGARRRMLSTFEELGAESIELRLPRDWETLTSWDFNNVRLPERAEPFLEHLRRDVRLFGVSLSPWINGLLLPGTEYLRGQRAKLLLLRRVLDDLFAQCDVVVQTSPIPFDMIGLPLVAFPIGVHDDGARRLPQGALLGGHPYAEDRLLSLVAGYQAVTQWHRERPSDPPVAGGGRAGAMPRSVGPRGRTDVWDIMAGGE